jgi:hypothetical protein
VVEFPIVRALSPLLVAALGAELHHWVETIIDTVVKLVCIAAAWWLTSVVAAVYSALRGGRIFARGLFTLLDDRGCLERLPCVPSPFDHDKTFVDELVAYPLAAAGFWFQLSHGFTLPFPLDLIFLPLTIVEWLLRWQISAAPAVLA